MANFTEVMKNGLRMCDTVDDCSNCPIRDIETGGCIFAFVEGPQKDAFERIEEKIGIWASMHPDPDGKLIDWFLGNMRKIYEPFHETTPFHEWICNVKLSDDIMKAIVGYGALDCLADHPYRKNKDDVK